MQRRSMVVGLSAGVFLAFAVLGAGCKKEETKVENTAPAPAAQPAPPPAPVAGGIFVAQITADKAPQSMKAGETVTLPVTLKNASTEKWVRDKAAPLNLSYHWTIEGGKKPDVWDGTRTPVTKDVPAGVEIVVNAKVTAPKTPGKYVLEMDMVQDGPNGGWFGKKGSSTNKMNVEIN